MLYNSVVYIAHYKIPPHELAICRIPELAKAKAKASWDHSLGRLDRFWGGGTGIKAINQQPKSQEMSIFCR